MTALKAGLREVLEKQIGIRIAQTLDVTIINSKTTLRSVAMSRSGTALVEENWNFLF